MLLGPSDRRVASNLRRENNRGVPSQKRRRRAYHRRADRGYKI